jgi:hypothetical protein
MTATNQEHWVWYRPGRGQRWVPIANAASSKEATGLISCDGRAIGDYITRPLGSDPNDDGKPTRKPTPVLPGC